MHDTIPLDIVEQVTTQLYVPLWRRWPGQLVRFSTVGGLNTALDLLTLNGLLWLFPTNNALTLVLFNSLAYAVGAINSFLLNKYWTFGHKKSSAWREVQRFVITTALGVACNDILLWCANRVFQALLAHSPLWVNASKLVAIAGTVLVSYFGMRLWVFVNTTGTTDAKRCRKG
jgi:putative flippase GtrA